MRYAYAITTALLLGGAAAAISAEQPAGAQTAQNEPGAISAAVPRAGAPMSFADMVAKLQPAVVNISTAQKVTVQSNPFAGTPFEMFGMGQGGGRPTTQRATSLGSGFVISPDGYVVTNNHVVAPGAKGAVVSSITVTLSDGKEYKARVVGTDQTSDLALLKIEGSNLPFVRWGDSNRARVGDWVVAIGEPYGLGGTVTAGIISAVHRVTELGGSQRFIQTDASINQGNSGGPMFDLNGNVIGINSMIYSPTGGNVGIGFAIPAETARPIIDTLMKGGKIQRGYLGVGIQPVTDDIASALGLPKNRGELISKVEPGQAAERGGLKSGDVVVKVGDRDVTPEQTLSYLVASLAPGTRTTLAVVRDGKPVTLTVTVGTRPPEDQLAGFNPDDDDQGMPEDDGDTDSGRSTASIGLSVVPLTPQIARQCGVDPAVKGVVIASADPSSDAGQKGLQRCDVVISVNRTPVASAAEVARAVAQAKAAGRSQVLLYVQRRANARYVPVEVGNN